MKYILILLILISSQATPKKQEKDFEKFILSKLGKEIKFDSENNDMPKDIIWHESCACSKKSSIAKQYGFNYKNYVVHMNNSREIFEIKKDGKTIARYDFLADAIYKKGIEFVMQQDNEFFENRLLAYKDNDKHGIKEERKLIEKTIEYSLYAYGSSPYQIAFDNKTKKVKYIKLANKK